MRGLHFVNPAGLWALLLCVPIVLLHVLRPRRPQAAVSSTMLWQAVEQPVSAARPWQRLRWSLLLFLQLLAVALLAVALAKPVRSTKAPLSAHTVFVIDASGSMAAADGSPDRISAARTQAKKLRSQLPAGGVASVVVASPEPRVALSASNDRAAFDAALAAISPIAGTARWEDTFNLAASLETPGKPIGIVLLSDGGLTASEQRAIPAGSSYVRIGDRAVNRALTVLSVEPRPGGLRARATVKNTGGPASRQTLRIDVDGRTRARLPMTIERGKSVDRTADLPAGDKVEAFLEGGDLLAADDHVYAVGARRRPLKVLLAGPGDRLLDELLASLPGISVERTPTARPAPGYDLAIYDRVAVPIAPGAPFLAIAAPNGVNGITVNGPVDQPALTDVADDPLLVGLDLSEVAIATAQRLTVGDANQAETDVLVAAESTPLLVRGSHDGRPFAYLAFSLQDSNLALQVAFPLLADRLLNDLAGAAPGTVQVRVGQSLPVDTAIALEVARPGSGGVVRRPAGAAAPIADRPGFWTIRQQGRPDRLVAVNADPAESALNPVQNLPIARRPVESGQRAPAGERSVLRWAVAAILVALGAEWLVARRRIGVPRRQWRAGALVRAAIVALLIAALINPSIRRTGKDVAVLFLVDASDSLSSSGKRAALDFTREALADAPKSAKAGVALFGGDARVESLVEHGIDLDTPAVQVDTARTNAAGALRLAPALLPPSSRRRVVLVSDGRFTDGDVSAEAQRLAEEGIPVDIVSVGPIAGSDVAVTRVDVPGRVGRGDRFSVRALVRAADAGPAVIRVRREDARGRETEIEARTVTLVQGDNVVDVDQTATEPGVVRYRVTVETQRGDGVTENDTAFGATEVEGPPKVLVAEGAPGEADALIAALRSTNVTVEKVAANALPALERLAEYRATVLVNVDARNLAPAQITSLAAATRDLGRGLVVIGGERSYTLGGYRDTPIEELLPVESEIRDPLRKKSVAQVLAIDTSGSMASCHCAGGTGGGGGRAEGGVNKTDISRTAAARSIAALSADDQIGILAFNTQHKWIIDLQTLPPEDVIAEALRSMTPRGNTDLSTPLLDAGEKLRSAKANLKHIILFTDGFSSTGSLAGMAGQAASLAEEGITVSVVGTGEGFADELGRVAQAGRGRFYPGTDLLDIPQIMVQETVLASRSFINEGEFVPTVTGAAAPVRDLQSAPPLLGYVATTAKPASETWLRIGADRDPLLASWRVGLGRVTAWTSDASLRWSQGWSTWDGYASFWAGIVRHAFPLSEGATLRAEVRGDRLRVEVDAEETFGDGAVGSARVSGPDGIARVVPLERIGPGRLGAELEAPVPGTYAVGADVRGPDGRNVAAASGLATRSYAAEYLPGPVDTVALERISARTKGRGAIESSQAFDTAGLRAGSSRWSFGGLLLLVAALLWPIDVALRRLTRKTRLAGVASAKRVGLDDRVGAGVRRLRSRFDVASAQTPPTSTPQPTTPSTAPVVRRTTRRAPPVSWEPAPVSGSADPPGVVHSPGSSADPVGTPAAGAPGVKTGGGSRSYGRSAGADSGPRPRSSDGSAPSKLDRLLAAKRGRAAPEPADPSTGDRGAAAAGENPASGATDG